MMVSHAYHILWIIKWSLKRVIDHIILNINDILFIFNLQECFSQFILCHGIFGMVGFWIDMYISMTIPQNLDFGRNCKMYIGVSSLHYCNFGRLWKDPCICNVRVGKIAIMRSSSSSTIKRLIGLGQNLKRCFDQITSLYL